MSLNEIIALIYRLIKSLPFGFADGVVGLSFIGFFIVESTYSASLVLRRLFVLFITSLAALFLYRLPASFAVVRLGISEGILEGISLLSIWMVTFLIVSLVVKKHALSGLEPPEKLRVPIIGIASAASFMMLFALILHIFISLPFPQELKRFLTGALVSQKTLFYTNTMDAGIQKLIYRNTYNSLHVKLIPESEKVDFKYIAKSPIRDMKTEEGIARWIIDEREQAQLPSITHEYIYSNAAQLFAKKSLELGSVENMSEEMTLVFSELGVTHIPGGGFAYLVDDSSLIIPILTKDVRFARAIRSGVNDAFGISVFDIGTNGWFVVIVFGE